MLKRQYQIRRKLQRWRDLQLEAFGMRRLFKKNTFWEELILEF